MHIHIPNNAWLTTLDPFLRGIDYSDEKTLTITAHDKWVSVHPVVCALIAALATKVGVENVQVDPNIYQARSAHYLHTIGLGNYGFPPLPQNRKDSTGRYIPVRQIRTAKEQSAFVADAVPLLHLEPRYAEPIQYMLGEMIRNVIEHAYSKHGAFVVAQYTAKQNIIRVGIADTGIGIRQSLSQFHNIKDDQHALYHALTPGITGTTNKEGGTSENAGAGLFITKSIAALQGDSFILSSGSALYKLLKQKNKPKIHADPRRDHHTLTHNIPHYQGTIIGFDMKLDETPLFSDIMSSVRDIYVSAIEERKQQRREPKFI